MLSDWTSVRSDHELAITAPQVQIQYRHYFNYESDISTIGIRGTVVTGHWTIQLIDSSNRVIFEQHVEFPIFIVVLGFSGVKFFTWIPQIDTISTTIVDGDAITEENPAWGYTLGGTKDSEFSTVVTDSVDGYTDHIAILNGFWESPVYKMSVPVGTKLKITQDSWGLGTGTSDWQFRYKEGSVIDVDIRKGNFGEMVFAGDLEKGPMTLAGHAWKGAYLIKRGLLPEGDSPSLVMSPNGTQSIFLMQSDGYWEYVSLDAQFSWSKQKYGSLSEGNYGPQAIFSSEYKMPQTIEYNNSRVSIAVKGSKLESRLTVGAGPGSPTVIGTAQAGQTYSLDKDSSGTILIYNNIGQLVFTSQDGTSWKAANS